jgi:hypothetical protein
MDWSQLYPFVAILPPTLAAIAAFIQGIKNGKTASEIHVMVNAQRSELKIELAAAVTKILTLESLVNRLDIQIAEIRRAPLLFTVPPSEPSKPS